MKNYTNPITGIKGQLDTNLYTTRYYARKCARSDEKVTKTKDGYTIQPIDYKRKYTF